MARPTPSIADSKRAADLLLKDLRSADCAIAQSAAERFRRIQPFKMKSLDEVLASRSDVQRKHALDVVAREQGYLAWKNLKDAADVLWCPEGSQAYWHNWCKTHAEARTYLDESGGYLLTAHGRCFIAEAAFVEFLGLDPNDVRWDVIGFDVFKPRDENTRDELVQLREKAAARKVSGMC
jgi:hypothetical protein